MSSNQLSSKEQNINATEAKTQLEIVSLDWAQRRLKCAGETPSEKYDDMAI